MVFDAALVLVVNLNDECEEFVVIDDLQEVVALEERGGHERHLHIASNGPREFEDVELKRVNLLVKVLMVLDQFFNVLRA